MEFLLLFAFLPLLVSGLFGGEGDNQDDDDDSTGGGETEGQIIRDDNGQSLIDGDEGDDLILGAGGADDISGDAGTDLLVGETGADRLAGGDDDDILFGGWGQDTLFGGSGGDVVVGGANNDDLTGGAGDDLLFGSSGADTLSGNEGDDLLIGVDVRDDLPAEVASGLDVDVFRQFVADTYPDGLRDSDVDRAVAGALNGNPDDPATDVLNGGDGSDELVGDQGDTLTGGAGEDVFTAYREAGDGAVLITDFDVLTESLNILIDGTATNDDLTYIDAAEGLAIRLDGAFVAILQGVTFAQFDTSSISVQQAA